MRKITNLLEAAEKALKETNIVDENGVVKDGVYEGYIAGFGAMVINLDLAPTIAIYQGDPKRKKVLEAFQIIIPSLFPLENETSKKDKAVSSKVFASHRNKTESRVLKSKLMDASVALKLMIRTFEIRKNTND